MLFAQQMLRAAYPGYTDKDDTLQRALAHESGLVDRTRNVNLLDSICVVEGRPCSKAVEMPNGRWPVGREKRRCLWRLSVHALQPHTALPATN